MNITQDGLAQTGLILIIIKTTTIKKVDMKTKTVISRIEKATGEKFKMNGVRHQIKYKGSYLYFYDQNGTVHTITTTPEHTGDDNPFHANFYHSYHRTIKSALSFIL